MAFPIRRFNRALAFRLALILVGMFTFVGVGYVSPHATQAQMFAQFWPVYFAGAVLILIGAVGLDE